MEMGAGVQDDEDEDGGSGVLVGSGLDSSPESDFSFNIDR